MYEYDIRDCFDVFSENILYKSNPTLYNFLWPPDVVELVGRGESHHTLAGEVHGDHLDGQPPLHVLRGHALIALVLPQRAPSREASSSSRSVRLRRGGGRRSRRGMTTGGPGPGPLRSSSSDHDTGDGHTM